MKMMPNMDKGLNSTTEGKVKEFKEFVSHVIMKATLVYHITAAMHRLPRSLGSMYRCFMRVLGAIYR